ncbi:uncharacterized protein LOC108319700 [Vigna angularis]|uniref:uncharacterized protein LOC108319700 n=1 Tax=Phaseolus angularis TaxID=3914 RepID=UPI000809C376|nr:uncharacterized protein LOC108319700 [Vigna angularis]
MCTNFTNLIKACPKDSYPLPSINALVEGTSVFQVLSLLDAYSGYNQIPMYPLIVRKQPLSPSGRITAMRRCMEVYVDDMVVRSKSVEDHVKDLTDVFGQVRKYGMRLNPAKCTFKVPAGNFLGFILMARGIEANPDKCKVVMKKSVETSWDDRCEEALSEVKGILANLFWMGRPDPKHDLYLFLAASKETINVDMSHQLVVRTDHPIANILRKTNLVGRIVGWSVKLSEFGLRFESHGSVRGQHLDDFAVELPQQGDEPLRPWKLYINNNQAEYEEVISGLELAKDLVDHSVECWTDSQLVVGKLNGSFQTKDDQLLRYYHKTKELIKQFQTVEVKHVPKAKADILSKKEIGELIKRQEQGSSIRVTEAKKIDRYLFIGDDLYRRGFSAPLLKCVSLEEAKYVMRELHEGACGMHTR